MAEHVTGDPRDDDRVVEEHRVVEDDRWPDQREVVGRQVSAYGGIKWGSAFFGWLAAMGLAVLLTALAAAIGTALGVSTGTDVDEAANRATQNVDTVGVVGGIVLAVILFVAYFCGGYVAGRMARFNGLRQGRAVWIWAVVIAVIVAIAATAAGAKYDVLSNLNGFPRLPVDQGDLTTGGVIALLVALAVALVGALLGGLAGMRYHRRVDRVPLVD
jgi:amino acid transporter